MLTAWHRFDKYERTHLCFILELDPDEVSKIPFMTVDHVVYKLGLWSRVAQYSLDAHNIPKMPVINYAKRIWRAVKREHRLKLRRERKRHRERIMV